jgi:peptide/nickel transport system permease protein
VRRLLQRAAQSLLLLVAVSLLSFALVDLAPGGYFDEMRLNPQISPATVAALRAQYGLDRPLPERYLRWLESTLRGELGFSFAYARPVGPLLRERALRTLGLTASAAFLSWGLALLLGTALAARPGGRVDRAGAALTSLLLAVPDVTLALGLLLFALRTGAFQVGGMTAVGFEDRAGWERARDVAWHAALPVAALVLASLPVQLRHVRTALRETLAAPYLLAARAHGVRPVRRLLRHALPAAAPPLVSLLGLSLAGLLSSSLLVENVMGWPGLGPLLLEAILARDVHVVVGSVVVGALLLALSSLLADALLFLLDPRLRRRPPI